MDEAAMHDLFEDYGDEPVDKIMRLITKYAKNHPLAKDCGGEYIYQNDEAQVDAIQLVSDIFDLYAEKEEEE